PLEVAAPTSALDDGAQILDPGVGRRNGLEARAGPRRDDPRERGLAGPGRAPEDHAGDPIGLDGPAKQAPGPRQVLLADVLVKGPRPHALGERRERGVPPTGMSKEVVVRQ